MRRHKITGLLFASALILAGTQLGTFQAQASPHDRDHWEDRWDDDEDERHTYGGWVNVVY